MTVTPGQVNEMSKLIAAMNAAVDSTPDHTPTSATSPVASPIFEGNAVPRTPGPVDNSTLAMGNILQAFYRATDGVVEEAKTKNYPELKKALVTEATKTGARVGSWEISVREETGMGKFYDVTHVATNEPIANDLRLYEAAHALVDALNEGHTINSARIKGILNFEEDYARNFTDAVTFATRMKVTEGATYDVAEARYSQCKHRAQVAKKSLTAFVKLG